MAKVSGYLGGVEISTDGKTTWHKILGITSKGFPTESQTEDVQTFDDNGQTNEEVVGLTTTVSLEGYVEEGSTAHALLKKAQVNKDLVVMKVRQNKNKTLPYDLLTCWVASLGDSQEIGGKTTYSVEFNVFGDVLHFGEFS